jgi:hypothetical protein
MVLTIGKGAGLYQLAKPPCSTHRRTSRFLQIEKAERGKT